MKSSIFEIGVVLVAFITTCTAIHCYQCSGSDPKEPFQCNEWLTDDIDIEPVSCDNVYDAKYCVKHVGRYEGGIGTRRFCSSLDLGNYCNYVQQPGDSLNYHTCIYTCTGDGCNPASIIRNNPLISFIIVTFGVFYQLCNCIIRQ